MLLMVGLQEVSALVCHPTYHPIYGTVGYLFIVDNGPQLDLFIIIWNLEIIF